MDGALRLVFDPRGAVLDSARDCEAEVFLRWFGNTRQQLAQEYGDYEGRSVFLALADERDQVLGAVRLLTPGDSAGFKTLTDVAGAPWGVDGPRAAAAVGIDLASTWEVATLSVRASTGHGTRTSMALYHGLMTVASVNRMSAFVAILDERVRRLLGSVGIATRQLPGTSTAPYLGSPSSTPVYSHFTSMLAHQRVRYPDAHRLITLGVGLDGVAAVERESFRLRPDRVLDLVGAEGARGLGVPA